MDMKKILSLMIVICSVFTISGCSSIGISDADLMAEEMVVVDEKRENDNNVIVASNENYQIKITRTVYNISSKRSLLIEIENYTESPLFFTVENIYTDEKTNFMQEKTEDTISANSSIEFPLAFKEWDDFQNCSGTFVITNEDGTINEKHDFHIYIQKSGGESK